MQIQYVVVDSGGWFEADRFLLPADRISDNEQHKDDFSADATKEQVKSPPRYNEKSLDSEGAWKKYLDEFKKYWVESPVMHRKGSDRIITPPEEPGSSRAASIAQAGCSRESGIPAAELFPDRISDVFSDTRPTPGEITLRPRSAERAEEAAQGETLLKSRWADFQENLREERESIVAECPHCFTDVRTREDVA
jgi:hypothetical protein